MKTLSVALLLGISSGYCNRLAYAQAPKFEKSSAICDWVPTPKGPPSPDDGRIFSATEGVIVPKLKCSVDPQFSSLARKKKLEGTCVVSTVIDPTGVPTDVQVRKSIADGLPPKMRKAALSLDENAVDAVRRYRFEPAMHDGLPVAFRLNVEVSFRLY